MSKDEFVKFWDEKIKPFAKKCCEIENPVDGLSKVYINSMCAAVEHDIADGRILGLGGINTYIQVEGCLNDDEYYTNVHHNADNNETRLLKEFGKLLEEGLNILMKDR